MSKIAKETVIQVLQKFALQLLGSHVWTGALFSW